MTKGLLSGSCFFSGLPQKKGAGLAPSLGLLYPTSLPGETCPGDSEQRHQGSGTRADRNQAGSLPSSPPPSAHPCSPANAPWLGPSAGPSGENPSRGAQPSGPLSSPGLSCQENPRYFEAAPLPQGKSLSLQRRQQRGVGFGREGAEASLCPPGAHAWG